MSVNNKISNIIGTALPKWLMDQLGKRANELGRDTRDNDNILFLSNKTAWVRLVSSININSPSDLSYFQREVGPNIQKPDDLAKQYVLFGGTSKYLRENSYQQRSGIGRDGAYGILGDSEIQQFGYRPMPGITSVSIDTQGTLGSLRMATVSFRCWDKAQLDIIDALYFKLGFTMFLEWGHTFFYPNNGNKVESTEVYSIDPFRQNLTKEQIALQITKSILQSDGNYDAMLGMVTNFNFSYNQEGGYDCTLKITGLGVLGDSIKINNPTVLPPILPEEILQLNNALLSFARIQALGFEATVSENVGSGLQDIQAGRVGFVTPTPSLSPTPSPTPSIFPTPSISSLAGGSQLQATISQFNPSIGLQDLQAGTLVQTTTTTPINNNTNVANITAQNQIQNQTPGQNSESENLQPNITQIKQALQYQSGLELTLRTIQVHALNRAINARGVDIQKLVYKLEMKDDADKIGGKFFYQQIFSNGVFSSFINELVDQSDSLDTNLFKQQSRYGFATEFMAGRVSAKDMNDNKAKVNFNELLTAYVVPYEVSQEIVAGINTNHPVYIPFGLLLMILNNICTIYDTKNGTQQTPLVYVDFNPNLNFFLSNTKHLTTNPFKVLIPYEGSFSDYKSIFPNEILNSDQTKILALSGSSQDIPLFNKEKEDRLSQQLPKVKFDGLENNVYRGKLMNVLLDIDYLIEVIKDNSTKDGSNSVYLKPFLEQILLDINKYLGDFSLLRLAYNDGGNTFHIVDDQVAPPLPGDTLLQPDNKTEIPLVGRFGLAKNLEIRSDVSTKLANMIAISANADATNKATLSTNGDSFGFINTGYRDRYIPERRELTGSSDPGKGQLDTLKSAAMQFNQTVSDFYSTINPSDANVPQATNYYIERMSKIKNNEFPTKASSMIPVSVNFTMDGIAGLTMGQAFSISDQLLPYTYNNRILQSQQGLTKDHINKVGFAVVGLNNTIENNQWNTSVRANMIFLKYATQFTGSVSQKAGVTGEFLVNPNNQNESIPVRNTNFVGTNSDAKKAAETYIGRSLTNEEWSQLVAATYAEASSNQQEIAWVMAVILNRTRTRFLGAQTITDTLTRRNQFQAVTGTSSNRYQPSPRYVNGPNKTLADSIYGAVINFLPSVPKNYLYFTSNVVAAYGPGTDITFLDKLKNAVGSKIIGQTVFSITG